MGPLQFNVTGFQLDQMPLGSSIGGKRKRGLRVLSTLLTLFDRKSVLLNFFVFLRIALRITNDATDFKNLGRSLVE